VARGGEERGVHLVEVVPGRPLTEFDDDEARMPQALGEAARFLARLHRVRGSGFGPLSLEAPGLAGVHERWDDYLFVRLAEHVAACEAEGAIARTEAERIAALFEASRAGLRAQRAALLHGDPGSHNFIVDASGIRGVVDWEDALLGDPLFDVASLCTFHPERRHGAILSGYGTALEPGSEAWTRFWLYFLRIALAKTVHRRRFGYADRPERAPASRRIQLALARLEPAH
jgi:hygromycin-B 4-O-kinase